MAKRVFVSFDYDNDKNLKDLIIGQSRNVATPFNVADWSMKEAAIQSEWEKVAERRIKQCDVVLVMVGKQTKSAPGVLKEVGFARKHRIPIVQVRGHDDVTREKHSVPNAGTFYVWNWANLKNILI